MPLYIYKGVTEKGQILKNKVEATDKFELLRKLKHNGITPIKVTKVKLDKKITKQNLKKKKNAETKDSVLKIVREQTLAKRNMARKETFFEKAKKIIFTNNKIKSRDIVIFTQNLYLLKKANFNNIHALSTIIETTENPAFKDIIEDILLGVEAGENMYTTMEYYEGVFPPIYINMIKVGELSGSLTRALEQAVKYLDDTAALNKKIRQILVPNLIQFGVLILLLVIGTMVGVPIIQNVFEQVGSKEQLPKITLWFKGVLDNFGKIWYIPVSIIISAFVGIYLYIKTPNGKYKFDNFKYRMPIFGSLIYAIDFSRLIKAILLNIQNGMRIQDALETSKSITNNLVMLGLIEASIDNILTGGSWITPFEQSGLSSPMITEMLKVGMQTDLAEMMEKLLEYMEIDIDNIMQRIIKILPQIIYVIVGIMLIFVTIVVLVPMIQVYMGTWLLSAYV